MVNKYGIYLRIGKALKTGDKKTASTLAQVIINSENHQRKEKILTEDLILSRDDKKIIKKCID